MVETYDPAIINEYLNGVASESFLMIKLVVQVMVVLVVGIFLWKIGSAFASRKVEKTRENFMSSSRFQKEWKKR